jgi:hypothetical protein
MGFLDRLKTRSTSPEEPQNTAQPSEYVGTDFTPSGPDHTSNLSQVRKMDIDAASKQVSVNYLLLLM